MGNKIELKRTVDLTEATQILEDLISSLKVGAVCVQKGGERVTLTPAGELKIEIEARQKKEKECLVIEMKWKLEKTSGMIICTGHSRDVKGKPSEKPMEITQLAVQPACMESLPGDTPKAPPPEKPMEITQPAVQPACMESSPGNTPKAPAPKKKKKRAKSRAKSSKSRFPKR